MKYWYGGADKDIEQTYRRVTYLVEHWKVFGFGDWAIISKEDSKIIGFAGLHYIKNVTEVNIGYAFLQSVWRKGFAYEACIEIMKYGFDLLKLDQIIAVIWPDNLASINLVKKCDFEYWKNIIWLGSDRVVYRVFNK